MKRLGAILYPVLGVVLAAAVLLALHFGWFDRETARVTLPDTATPVPAGEPGGDAGLTLAAVTPETVQAVVGTLARPDGYARELRVTDYWDGGSRSWNVRVWQKGGATRIALTPEDGAEDTKNILLLPDGSVSIWYSEGEVFTSALGDATLADTLQMIPTYEEILTLDSERIEDAGYVRRGESDLIRVTAREEPTGCLMSYYISTETGLLEAAERYDGEKLVYRMIAGAAELAAPSDYIFVPGSTAIPLTD